MNECPICLKPAVYQCRCMRSDASCEAGHSWHRCLVHKKVVLGKSDHGKHGCSCVPASTAHSEKPA